MTVSEIETGTKFPGLIKFLEGTPLTNLPPCLIELTHSLTHKLDLWSRVLNNTSPIPLGGKCKKKKMSDQKEEDYARDA